MCYKVPRSRKNSDESPCALEKGGIRLKLGNVACPWQVKVPIINCGFRPYLLQKAVPAQLCKVTLTTTEFEDLIQSAYFPRIQQCQKQRFVEFLYKINKYNVMYNNK